MQIRRPRLGVLGLATALLLAAPSLASAQPLADRPGSASIGGRVGYNTDGNGALILGAGARTSVPGIDRFELNALVDFTFLNNLTERQINVDLLYQLGGLALGGGPAFRNTIWIGEGAVRETRTGYSVVAIFGGQAGQSFLAAHLELRYSKVSDFSPSGIHLGINIPLTRF